MNLLFARAYSHLYRLVKKTTRRNLPGLGFALRTVRSPVAFPYQGAILYFQPNLAVNYGLTLTGHPTEPETHKFFNNIAGCSEQQITVIDVGANIGEMAVPWARKAKQTYAFEPYPACASVIRKAAELTNVNVDVRQIALSDHRGRADLVGNNEGDSRIVSSESGNVVVSTLDTELPSIQGPSVILVDTEGSELNIIQGGQRLIAENLPLIIFEYNNVTRQHFAISDMQRALGHDYKIYRLRPDGLLDTQEPTWNAVAISNRSDWHRISEQFIKV